MTNNFRFLSVSDFNVSQASYKLQDGNVDHALKPDFYIFLLIFRHKCVFLSTMQTLPFEGNNLATLCVTMK